MKALALLFFLLAPGVRAGDPVADAVKKAGLSLVRSVSLKAAGGARLTAVLAKDAEGGDKLRVYGAGRKGPRLVYMHFGAEKLALLDAPKGLVGEAPAFLYSASGPGPAMLNVLRVEGRKVRAVGRFPDARVEDLDGDGKPEIVSRERPLGRTLAAECESLHAVTDKAVRTEVRAWRAGKFEDVSRTFPGFFDAAIARGEEEIPSLEPADRLGAALALYYDHAAKGEKRQGWERLTEMLDSPSSVPGLKACARRVKKGLREKLAIPNDWP